MARPAIFEPKSGARRQSTLTLDGERAFEAARLRLANLSGWTLERVSDADTIEYLARGHSETARYLKQRGPRSVAS